MIGKRSRYYVTPKKKGPLLAEMVKASTVAEAMIVLPKIKKLASAETEPSPDWAKQIARFLKAGDHICATIISRCDFVTEEDPIACIRDALVYIPEDKRADYPAAIIGLARDQIDALIRAGKPRAIRAGAFRRAVWTFISRHNFSNILRPSGTPPEDAVVEAFAATDPLFVRQLVAIEAGPNMMMMAVSDYLRTTADKIDWADSGIVLEDSFVEFDTQLTREHAFVCEEIDDGEPGLSGAERGRKVYRLCRRTQMPLEGQNLPPYFIAGAFNCLAQDQRIGWHPDYLTLFPTE